MSDVLVNGIRLNYEVHGDGTPLVLAHGYGATLDMWSEQIDDFSRKCRVVVYDTRGHGRTEAPRDWSSYNVDDYVEDQRQLMDHLGIDSAYVGGLSMGGMIALQFALTYPERIKALLLCDTAASNRRLGGMQGDEKEGRVAAAIRGAVLRDVVPLGFAVAPLSSSGSAASNPQSPGRREVLRPRHATAHRPRSPGRLARPHDAAGRRRPARRDWRADADHRR